MKKKAFTLIELSIVLVIIGLLVGGSFKILKVMRDRAEVSRAKDDVEAAKGAVIGNTLQNNNTLPSATFFNDNLSPIKSNQHQLFYADDANLQDYDVCSFSTTNLSVITPTKTIDNVAFVIASEASNHNMQTALTDDGDDSFSVTTYDYSEKVDDNTSPVDIVEYYDDVVDWVTLAQLQKELQCSLKPFRFINTTLPTANVGDEYSATLYVENNITDVTITCTPEDDMGISYSSTTSAFSGTPTEAGTSSRDCNATESSPGSRSIIKHYVITINPVTGGSSESSSNSGTTNNSETKNNGSIPIPIGNSIK